MIERETDHSAHGATIISYSFDSIIFMIHEG